MKINFIYRVTLQPCQIGNIDFLKEHIQYPLLIYKNNNQNCIEEIIIKEKQRAIGVQPMLYFCFGIDLLSNNKNEVFINRYIKTGESGFF